MRSLMFDVSAGVGFAGLQDFDKNSIESDQLHVDLLPKYLFTKSTVYLALAE